MPKLTIAICTYNRLAIIGECLASIKEQITPQVDVVLINNYPSDDQHTALKEAVALFPFVRLYYEPKVGLSYARNRALTECQSPWIAYMDDDARLGKDYIAMALQTIDTTPHQIFGGHIRSWWYYGRPKWLSDSWGNKPILSDVPSVLKKDEFLWASNFILKTELIQAIGGFPTAIGMIGERLGYGVENIVQMKLREQGIDILYLPALIMEHIIIKEKLSIKWHLRSIRSTVRDSKMVFSEQYTLFSRFKKLLRVPVVCLRSTIKWIGQKDYYWQNLILDLWKSVLL